MCVKGYDNFPFAIWDWMTSLTADTVARHRFEANVWTDFGGSVHNPCRRKKEKLARSKFKNDTPCLKWQCKKVVPNAKCVNDVEPSLLQGASGFRPSGGSKRILLRRSSSAQEAQEGQAWREARPSLRGELDQVQRYHLLGFLYRTGRFVVMGYWECEWLCIIKKNNNRCFFFFLLLCVWLTGCLC